MILLGSLFLVTLASSTTVLYSTPACDAWCQEKGYAAGDLLGTAPFCGGSCSTDCTFIGSVGTCTEADTDKYQINSGCVLGQRSCCCKWKSVDCIGGWSGCGQIEHCKMTYYQSTPAQNGGKACPHKAGDTKICCEEDCYGRWLDCDANCKQSFKVLAEPIGGAPCPADRTCSPGTGACPAVPSIDCVGTWSSCSSKTLLGGIGGAVCLETFSVTTAAAHGGKACSAAHGQTRACNTHPDCAPTPEPTAEAPSPPPAPTPPPTKPPTKSPTPRPVNLDKPIDTLAKLQLWCNESVDNCKVCRGKDQDDGTCKTNAKRISKCRTFKKNRVCDMIVGCRSVTNKKGKTKCKGKKHGLA